LYPCNLFLRERPTPRLPNAQLSRHPLHSHLATLSFANMRKSSTLWERRFPRLVNVRFMRIDQETCTPKLVNFFRMTLNTTSLTTDRTESHRTSHTGSQQTRRSPPLPATRSGADKADAPAMRPVPCARSTILPASPAVCVSPSPCADSTNTPCAYSNTFDSRIRTCTPGC